MNNSFFKNNNHFRSGNYYENIHTVNLSLSTSYYKYIFSRFSSNSEAFASELLKTIENESSILYAY